MAGLGGEHGRIAPPLLLWIRHCEAGTYVVSFEVKVREVDGDAVLCWSDDLPDTVLVRRIQIWERRTLNGAVSRVDLPSTRVF